MKYKYVRTFSTGLSASDSKMYKQVLTNHQDVIVRLLEAICVSANVENMVENLLFSHESPVLMLNPNVNHIKNNKSM